MNELTPEARAILQAHKKAFLQGQLSMLAILEKSFDDEDWRRRVSMVLMFRLAPRRMIRRFWEKMLTEQEQLLCETQDRQSVPFAPAIIQVKWKEEQERKEQSND